MKTALSLLLLLAATAVGQVAGSAGLSPSLAEAGVALSLALIGTLLIAFGRTAPAVAIVAVGVSGLFHGFVHGAELASSVAAPLLLAGTAAGTAALHAAGFMAMHGVRIGARPMAASALGVMAIGCAVLADV
jgi:urease accessory protein